MALTREEKIQNIRMAGECEGFWQDLTKEEVDALAGPAKVYLQNKRRVEIANKIADLQAQVISIDKEE
jgi:hypothetical protein